MSKMDYTKLNERKTPLKMSVTRILIDIAQNHQLGSFYVEPKYTNHLTQNTPPRSVRNLHRTIEERLSIHGFSRDIFKLQCSLNMVQ